jgi:hypothetical protein
MILCAAFKTGLALFAAGLLAGCAGSIPNGGASPSTPAGSPPAIREAVLTAEGVCDSAGSASQLRSTEIALGIGECDLVRLKGTTPTDVLIGDSGKGQREAQVLYNETTGREIYLFSDNRLIKIVKPGKG